MSAFTYNKNNSKNNDNKTRLECSPGAVLFTGMLYSLIQTSGQCGAGHSIYSADLWHPLLARKITVPGAETAVCSSCGRRMKQFLLDIDSLFEIMNWIIFMINLYLTGSIESHTLTSWSMIMRSKCNKLLILTVFIIWNFFLEDNGSKKYLAYRTWRSLWMLQIWKLTTAHPKVNSVAGN